MLPLLTGHDPTPRIVAAHLRGGDTIRLYIRDAGAVHTQDAPFFPFFFLSDPSLIHEFPGRHWVKELEGPGFYRYLCVVEQWQHLWDAVQYALERHNRATSQHIESHTRLEQIHVYADPVSQYLMQTGRTMFKEMEPGDLHRMQLDIETYTPPHHRFPVADRPSDRIIIVSLSDNRGWEEILEGRALTEKRLLETLVGVIRERDPDVIEGHNILSYDLPYIQKRCALHGVPFAIGRDGSTPRTFASRSTFAERTIEHPATDIAGRHVVDTLLLVQGYDMVKREMESYGLKYAARYFGFASPDRTYIEGSRISWHWDNDAAPLLRYALDDVRETRMLSEHLGGSTFFLTQMLPIPYGTVVRMGAAQKIESLMVREYLRRKRALPGRGQGVQTTGGYTDIFVTGVPGPIIHADVESLYPSIMLQSRIAPSSDTLGVFQELLRELTSMRLAAKKQMRAAGEPAMRSRLDALQSSYKILINSFYGYLGYSRALFNDYPAADTVTRTGQLMLRTMMAFIRSEGGMVVEVDTDGIFFVPPDGVRGEEPELAFVRVISDRMPEGINVALDGRYARMMSYKRKNYALLDYGGKIRIKGSSLISRSMERFGRQYVEQCVGAILGNDIARLHTLYTDLHATISARKLAVRDFARRETLRDPMDVYLADVAAGKRNRSAAYEVALAAGKGARPGERVAFYITGSDPNPRGFSSCKSVELWNPNFPDENIPFYLRRLDEFSSKFEPFFTPTDFRQIFSPDTLFPIDPAAIQTITRDVAGPEPPGDDAVVEEED